MKRSFIIQVERLICLGCGVGEDYLRQAAFVEGACHILFALKERKSDEVYRWRG